MEGERMSMGGNIKKTLLCCTLHSRFFFQLEEFKDVDAIRRLLPGHPAGIISRLRRRRRESLGSDE